MADEIDFPFDTTFQKKLLKLLIEDPDFLMIVRDYLKSTYFATEHLKWVFETISTYYDKYQKAVTTEIFIQLITDMDSDKDKLEYVAIVQGVFQEEVKEPEFIKDRLEEFIQRNIYVRGYEIAARKYSNNDFKGSLEHMKSCLEEVEKSSFKNADRVFFFEEWDKRVFRRNSDKQIKKNNKVPTGIVDLDIITRGGLSRGELGVVVGDAKAGKSICLVHLGANTIANHLKLLHIQLEGRDDQIEDRYDARILHKKYSDIISSEHEINPKDYYKMYYNSFVISNMTKSWDYTVMDIENELSKLRAYDFKPDVIVVDYGDLLTPRKVSRENTYLGQEEVYRDLKTIAIKYDCVVWTAAQTSRPSKDAIEKVKFSTDFVWTRHNLADCYAKVRIADLLLTINMTQQEQQHKKARLFIDAYRDNTCSKIFSINTNYENIEFYVPTQAEIAKYANFFGGMGN